MKKILSMAITAVTVISVNAQSAIDAYTLSQQDLRGTARFMSMGGAFGALGGDLSSLNQNPAGIGLYRSSEIGLTLDFDFTSSNVDGVSTDKTHVLFNNCGYIGAIKLDNDVMPFFQWGVSYNRNVSFNRSYAGGIGDLGTSMSNYIANFTSGQAYPGELGMSTSYNPYSESNFDWLSILAFNSYVINSVGNTDNFNGLFVDNQTTGNAQFDVWQRGYVDEYAINFGGNISNLVYWGLGFGITDLEFNEDVYYDEELQGASIAKNSGLDSGVENGNAYYQLHNWRHVRGSGFNFKIGTIIKPINELRFGLAVHTPTYYALQEDANGDIFYSYSSDIRPGTAYTNYDAHDWKLRNPWRLIASVAGVVGGRFILSADYEYDAYDSMKTSNEYGTEYTYFTDDIKYYYRGASQLRLGAEYRLTPQWSVRAGFANAWSALKEGVNEGEEYIYTSGTNPAFTFDTSTCYLTCGIGYRTGSFYIDAAYVNKYRKSTYQPFSSFDDGISWVYNPYADFTTTENNLVISLGVKF